LKDIASSIVHPNTLPPKASGAMVIWVWPRVLWVMDLFY
jgi:hypothetical protein